MSPGEALRARMERRLRSQVPELAALIQRLPSRIFDKLSQSEMAARIAAGQDVIPPELLDEVFAELQRAYIEQAFDNLNFWGKDLGASFNVLNPAVLEEVRRLNIKMASSFKAEVHDTVRAAVEGGMRQGLNPREVARGVRQNLLLTDKQMVWVDNFRAELEQNSRKALSRELRRGFFRKPDGSTGFRSAHAGGQGLSERDFNMLNRKLGTADKLRPDQIDRVVDAYRKRLTAWHAESVSRTAALDSLKNTQHTATEQAIREGILDEARMMSAWIHSGDSRVRPEHKFYEEVPFGHEFRTGEVIPGENSYNCRCIKRDFQAREPWVAKPAA